MKQHFSPARPAIAAIAAVIALPSTAALAQTVDAAPPVILAPPAVEPAAPAPTQAAPAPVLAPQVIFQPSAPVVQPTPAPAAPVIKASEEAPVARPATRVARKAVPVQTPAADLQAPITEVRPNPAPVKDPTPTPIERTEIASQPLATSDRVQPEALPEEQSSDTAVWLLGLGALGLLAGGAYAAARRNRRDVDERVSGSPNTATQEAFMAVDPAERLLTPEEKAGEMHRVLEPDIEPQFLAPTVAPKPAPTTVMDRPSNDPMFSSLSERREALVAEAPSAENPFRTRTNRLRRANFILGREGSAASTMPNGSDERADARNAQQTLVESPQVSYSFGRTGSLKPPVLKPQYN